MKNKCIVKKALFCKMLFENPVTFKYAVTQGWIQGAIAPRKT